MKDKDGRRGLVAVGVGSAGCRILSQMEPSIGRQIYVTADEDDLALNKGSAEELLVERDFVGKVSPYHIRGLALKRTSEIREMLEGSKLVFCIAGLGGSVGSALAPVVAQIGRDVGAVVVCVVVMPFRTEKEKHFYAGTTLKMLRKVASGVIMVDNDELLERFPREPWSELCKFVNCSIGAALSSLAGLPSEEHTPVGLNKLVDTVTRRGFAVLSICNSESMNKSEEAVIGAVTSTYSTAHVDEAENAILHIISSEEVSMGEVISSVNNVSSLLGKNAVVTEVGFSFKQRNDLTAVLLTSGFETTKFDKYDPLGAVLGDRQLDDSYDVGLTHQFPGLANLE